jgi:hypothetical protein
MNMNPELYPANSGGYGGDNVQVLQDLTKALEAGAGVDAGSMSGGRALIPESLENTLVNVLWSQDEARLFQRIKKQSIPSPVHQWNKRTAVGAFDGAWVPEGGSSVEADQTIARVYKQAKYLQTLRKATLQATLSNMIENAMTIEQNAGALWIIRQVEHALFYGNSAYVDEEPDGLLAQITDSDNILDVRGASADSATFETKMSESARVIRDNYGKGSLMLTSTMVMQDVQTLIRDRIRFGAGNAGAGTAIFNKFPTPFGELELLDDVFIKEGSDPAPSALAGAPVVPTESSAPGTGGTANSQWAAADIGAYFWVVEAINKYGASPEFAMTTFTPAAGNSVTMTVGHATTATAIKVYRSKKGGPAADAKYMRTVAVANPGTDTTTVVLDVNADLPGTSQVFILTMDQLYDAIEFFQFLPMLKFDLYPTNQAVYPFLMLLFGALGLKKQEQHAYIKNVSPSNLGWF